MCKWALVSKTPEEQQQSSHSGERMTDCVTEKTQKRGEKEENRGTERRGVRGKKRAERRGERENDGQQFQP